MEFDLKLKQETKLILTQEMKLSMKILQMSSSNLKDYLEKEIVSNPAIEVDFSSSSKNKNNSNEEDFSPLDYITKEETLIDYLEEQIGYLRITPKIREVCIFIINNLNSKGYLGIPKLDIKKILKLTTFELNEAFSIIHNLEPSGVGAENLKDCLKIQLNSLGNNDTILFKIIDLYLEELANQRFDIPAKELGISENEVRRYLEIIRKLSPIPARGYLVDTSSNYIIPEAKVEIVEGKLIYTLNDEAIPKVSLNNIYLNSENSNKNSIYMAMNIVKSLEKRYQTLGKILDLLLIKQKDYFFMGENFLKTLTLKEIAKELELHDSTISRAIKEKYIETPQGIISLRSLFILDSNTIGIKNMIEEMIIKENKKNPLSDEKIASFLEMKGFSIARRTVTKYREELGYLSTRERKRKDK